MSKQTINIGASPNDGTGTPLRTSFDYTNQNFTELYTALGGGVGLPGATTQVIFNDGGTNLAGDAGLVYNKTTDALTVAGLVTAGSATITGDLTVDTNTLKVDSTNDRVGIGTTTPACKLEVVAPAGDNIVSTFRSGDATAANNAGGGFQSISSATAASRVARVWLDADGADLSGGDYFFIQKNGNSGTVEFNQSSNAAMTFLTNGTERYRIASDGVATWSNVGGVAGTAMTLNANGLGIGVTPSAWGAGSSIQLPAGAGNSGIFTSNRYALFGSNAYNNAGWKYIASEAAAMYVQDTGSHAWFNAAGGTAGNAITDFASAKMTLDASGNLLVGVASGTTHVIYKNLAPEVGNVVLDIYGSNTSATFYSVSSFAANAANAAVKVGRDNTTTRSINAGGTVNASGADYAEYMTKSGDFILSKGDVAGIDSNGKLTNVFADAVSFVVKSTDPSYVGNDKWGVDLEGAAIEAARQLVDRIAFAGQVPVNVTGAKAGDYIVPVVDGTGIKGISVSKPTFEQYQLAVGKVIAIDTDGRARIIVKVA